jgi:hypothetical protein
MLCGGGSGLVGLCPGCPEGGKGGRGLHSVPCHLPFLEKGLGTFAFTEQLLGPGSSSLMIPLVPGYLCPVLSLVVVLGRCNRQGPINKSSSESDTRWHFRIRKHFRQIHLLTF